MQKESVGIIGAGTMGAGIALVAATAGHVVHLFDSHTGAAEKAVGANAKILTRQVEKGRISAADQKRILDLHRAEENFRSFSSCGLVIEAIIEDLSVKRAVFADLEKVISETCVVATNTSSLSVTALGASFRQPHRFLGVHFFNPAPLMPLVEIVPGVQTASEITIRTTALVTAWGKKTVQAKDTPGFIVNRVARPYYGESLRILEEGMADAPTIDWAMREIGGFRMGPFELMDLIGNDINLKVTESVFAEFFYDPRYKPSLLQKRMVEAGRLGKKSGRGYYDYAAEAQQPAPNKDTELGQKIVRRVLVMLINEAIDLRFLNIASVSDIDLAMTLGVNYPHGLLKWADDLGLESVLGSLSELQSEYGEDRYRPNPLLRRMVQTNQKFYA